MGFSLAEEAIALPRGAWAAGRRTLLMHEGRPVLGLTQGAFRSYLFPVFTPAGFAVTSESPADHPHHHSVWVGADHVHLHVPSEQRTEVYSYNFYVNEVFQGRAPGRILQTGLEGHAEGDAMLLTQRLRWLGPREWGAPDGRHVLDETRAIRVRHLPCHRAYRLEMTSSLSAVAWPVSIGPTRHAWFNARIGPGMAPVHGGRSLAAAPCTNAARPAWRACAGPVGGGLMAGLAMTPWPAGSVSDWYASPWGVMTANPCLHRALNIEPGKEPLTLAARLLVFDGQPENDRIEQALADC